MEINFLNDPFDLLTGLSAAEGCDVDEWPQRPLVFISAVASPMCKAIIFNTFSPLKSHLRLGIQFSPDTAHEPASAAGGGHTRNCGRWSRGPHVACLAGLCG